MKPVEICIFDIDMDVSGRENRQHNHNSGAISA